jgi:hypothetical protein
MLHFVFELSGDWKPIAAIAAVNESVWEHLKLAFWPAVAYTVLEHNRLKKSVNNFLVAKAFSVYLVPFVIAVLFYSYTAVLEESLLIDILIFGVAIAVGQLGSYKLLTSRQLPQSLNRIALIAIVLLAFVFPLLTYYPPRLELFRDPVTGGYGIP